MELPLYLGDDQQRVVDHDAGLARVRGSAGTGKTTALAARYLRLLDDDRHARVLVVCATGQSANRFRSLVVPHLRGGFIELAVTTWAGLASDLIRTHQPCRILGRSEQRALVARLLREGGEADWPACASLLPRDGFVTEVAAAVRALQATPPDRVALVDRTRAAGVAGRWADLLEFDARYRRALAELDAVDTTGMLVRAAEILATGEAAYTHVLVDDHQNATELDARLLDGLTAGAHSVVVAANPDASFAPGGPGGPTPFERLTPRVELALTQVFRPRIPGVLVQCSHPAVEGEAVAGELLAARDGGIAWQDMAVVLRRRGDHADAVVRALARHRIPARALTADDDRPAARALLDLLRWVAGDHGAFERVVASPISGLDAMELRAIRREAAAQPIAIEAHPRLADLVALHDRLVELVPTSTPAAVAFAGWEQAIAPLVVAGDAAAAHDQVSIDAISDLLRDLDDIYDREPGIDLQAALDEVERSGRRRRLGRAVGTGAVTVTTADAAISLEWDTVVVAGCVEGSFPWIRSRSGYFDLALLADDVTTIAERRAQSLGEERRLFCDVVATRATGRLVAIAAHQPGVLLSRFVEGWPRQAPRPRTPSSAAPVVHPRPSVALLVHPDRTLRLSASQLDTYEDCPLRYAYQYPAGVKGDGTVSSELGTLVHEVLAAFLDPAATHTRDGDTLRRLAETMWRDDIARFRPQVEEARRDYFKMLDEWWEQEGVAAPEVLAIEHDFEITVGPHLVVGKIDRIDRVPGGLRIVDFKTGKREPAEKEMPDNLQLAVYHLAATRDPAVMAWGEPVLLDLVFLRTMNIRRQEITADHAARTEQRILALADRILAEDFAPSPHANCRYCDFHRLCPLQPEGREVGAA